MKLLQQVIFMVLFNSAKIKHPGPPNHFFTNDTHHPTHMMQTPLLEEINKDDHKPLTHGSVDNNIGGENATTADQTQTTQLQMDIGIEQQFHSVSNAARGATAKIHFIMKHSLNPQMLRG